MIARTDAPRDDKHPASEDSLRELIALIAQLCYSPDDFWDDELDVDDPLAT